VNFARIPSKQTAPAPTHPHIGAKRKLSNRSARHRDADAFS
jgi:hypothetical protein